MDGNYIITSDGSFADVSELYHHGIKGMKWGVRRYQNKDGTLTPAGKKRKKNNVEDLSSISTDELRRKVNRLNNEQRYINLTKTTSSPVSKTTDSIDQVTKIGGDVNKIYKAIKGDKNPYGKLAGQGLDAVAKTSRLARKIDDRARTTRDTKIAHSKIEGMSDQDLAKTVERLDLERQYKRLKSSDIQKGKIHVKDVLDVAGDVIGISASAVTIAVSIKKLMNKQGR